MDYRGYLIKQAAAGLVGEQAPAPASWFLNPVNKGDRVRKFLKNRKIQKSLQKEAMGLRRAQRLARLMRSGKFSKRREVFKQKHGIETRHPYETALHDVRRRLLRRQPEKAFGVLTDPDVRDTLKYVARKGRNPLEHLERMGATSKAELLGLGFPPGVRPPVGLGVFDPLHKIKGRYRGGQAASRPMGALPGSRVIGARESALPAIQFAKVKAKVKAPGGKWKKRKMRIEDMPA